MSSVYYDGLEEMLADQRDYDRELAWERLERLERADTLAPLGLTSSPAAAGVPRGQQPGADLPSHDRSAPPTAPNPAEASSKGHASQPGDGSDRKAA